MSEALLRKIGSKLVVEAKEQEADDDSDGASQEAQARTDNPNGIPYVREERPHHLPTADFAAGVAQDHDPARRAHTFRGQYGRHE
jgi:hypothetical protein